jgi:hypothetical protein
MQAGLGSICDIEPSNFMARVALFAARQGVTLRYKRTISSCEAYSPNWRSPSAIFKSFVSSATKENLTLISPIGEASRTLCRSGARAFLMPIPGALSELRASCRLRQVRVMTALITIHFNTSYLARYSS